MAVVKRLSQFSASSVIPDFFHDVEGITGWVWKNLPVLLSVCTFLPVAVGCGGASENPVELPIERTGPSQLPVLSGVTVGSARGLRMVVDFGATSTCLSPTAAKQAGLEGEPGQEVRAQVLVPGDGQAPRTCRVLLLSRRAVRRWPLQIGPDVDGILGLDALRGRRALLDLSRGVLALGPGDGGARGARSRLPTVQVELSVAGVEGDRVARAIVDTGADRSFATRSFAGAVPEGHGKALTVRGREAKGEWPVKQIRVAGLETFLSGPWPVLDKEDVPWDVALGLDLLDRLPAFEVSADGRDVGFLVVDP